MKTNQVPAEAICQIPLDHHSLPALIKFPQD